MSTTIMYSGPTMERPVSTFPLHERQHADHSNSYATIPARHAVELPRLLEPRPSLQFQPSSLSNTSSASQRRPEPIHPPTQHQQSDYRVQQPTQSLPRLHDILTSGPAAPSPSSYSSGWNATAGPSIGQAGGESYYNHAPYRQPPAFPPHDAASQAQAQAQPGRRLELPVLETSPVARHDSHAVPLSPFAGYPDSARDYDALRERNRQPSAGSFQHLNGAPSPYAVAGTNESLYRSPATALERPPSNAFTPAGPESSKKYLGIRDLPGDGTYHVYEGGYRIPTHVDGETVNPAWGLTKANKPRKRLAMACLDCREKKIKCEPGPVSCLQCEKAKRPCRKAPPHQSQSDASLTPTWQNGDGSPARNSISELTASNARDSDPESANKRRTVDEISPLGAAAKKHRSASPIFAMHHASAPQPTHFPSQPLSPTMPRSPGKVLSWEEDPYKIEPDMTLHLLEQYFTHVNEAAYCLFPRRHFLQWVMNTPQKCQNERLVLYAMLAIGSVFANDRCSGFGKHCASIATEAVQVTLGRFSMPLVQTRLLLGMYHFAKGARGLAWDYIASGIHASRYLQYHTEQGCSEVEGKPRNEFDFSKEQLIECRRRTTWSGFLMDHYCYTRQSVVSAKDIFLRLPCTDESYERGHASNAPFHNNGIIDSVKTTLTSTSPVSPMAWQVLITVIWADVVEFIHGAVYRSSVGYEEAYERFYDETWNALQGWASRLPEQLRLSQTNAERCIRGGYAGPFLSMHLIYHLTWLKMNRFARHQSIPTSIARNVRATNRHAHELLQVINLMGAANRQVAEKEGYQATFTITSPFAGYAILAAIDVVGAGGLDTNLKSTLDLINCGLDCLRELGTYWNSARDQHKDCERRYYQIHNVLKHPFTARSGCWLGREWGVQSSLERDFASENDCIYGVTDRQFFDALKD